MLNLSGGDLGARRFGIKNELRWSTIASVDYSLKLTVPNHQILDINMMGALDFRPDPADDDQGKQLAICLRCDTYWLVMMRLPMPDGRSLRMIEKLAGKLIPLQRDGDIAELGDQTVFDLWRAESVRALQMLSYTMRYVFGKVYYPQIDIRDLHEFGLLPTE